MENIIMITIVAISILIISIVLLQSNKAEGASQVISGGTDLFTERKERGVEKAVTRVTFVLIFTFILLTFLLSYVL